jgi:hypothetical protein
MIKENVKNVKRILIILNVKNQVIINCEKNHFL